jgi:hypothetical protein
MSFIPVDSSARLEAIKESLPEIAKEKFALIESLLDKASGESFVRTRKRMRLREQREELMLNCAHLERQTQTLGLDARSKAQLESFRRKIDKVTAQMKKLDEPMETPRNIAPEHRAALPVLGRFAGDFDSPEDFVLRAVGGQRLVECRAELPRGDLNKAADALNLSILDKAAEIHRVNAAPLTVLEQKAAAKAEVEKLAKEGRPDISGLARNKLVNAGGVRRPGSIVWPHKPIQVISYKGSEQVQEGVALLAWMYTDDLLKRLYAEIEAATDSAAAMTVEERATRIAKHEAELMDLQRREERVLTELDEAGDYRARKARAGARHPLAYLECDFA